MFVDTHCHLNFAAFDGRVEETLMRAAGAGVKRMIVPGTDVATSKKAVEIAAEFEGIYAAVGIHPHHLIQYLNKSNEEITFSSDLKKIESLLENKKVVAVGEVGIDKHQYRKTKHQDYGINEEFVRLQKLLFVEQIKLAHKYRKSLIIHCREAKKEILELLTSHYRLLTGIPAVFHCCEPDPELLSFAIKQNMFIGVDGDVVYWQEKQKFIKNVPLEMLVLETDSPYLSPFKKFPNEPKNIVHIAGFIASLRGCPIDLLRRKTTENAERLFNINTKSPEGVPSVQNPKG